MLAALAACKQLDVVTKPVKCKCSIKWSMCPCKFLYNIVVPSMKKEFVRKSLKSKQMPHLIFQGKKRKSLTLNRSLISQVQLSYHAYSFKVKILLLYRLQHPKILNKFWYRKCNSKKLSLKIKPSGAADLYQSSQHPYFQTIFALTVRFQNFLS